MISEGAKDQFANTIIPGAEKLYHRLCSVTHPSSDSMNYFYDTTDTGKNGSFRLAANNDSSALSKVLSDYPDALRDALMMSCNPPLLILRVLHKFGIHPKLTKLKTCDFRMIKVWPEIARFLKQ